MPVAAAILWSVYFSGLSAGEDGEIAPGDTVILDTDTVAMGRLVINNTAKLLGTNDYQDISFTAQNVHIEDGGEFRIGAPDDRFAGSCVITINGARPSRVWNNTGHYRSIMVHGAGKFLMYPVKPTPWVRLEESALEDDTDLTLASTPSNWLAGHEIVITPTDHRDMQTPDLRVLASNVSSAAASITAGLSTDRLGVFQYLTDTGWSLTPGTFTYPPDSDSSNFPTILDERAIVANLTRGISVQGPEDTAWTEDGFGPHVMVMDLACQVYVDGVEFLRCGQAGHLGRYPIHWHMLSYESIPLTPTIVTSLTSSTTLTPAVGATLCVLQAGDVDLRYTTDGTTPTSSTGILLSAHRLAKVVGDPDDDFALLSAIKVIQTSSGGEIKASWFGGEGAFLGNVPEDYGVVKNCVFRDCSQRGVVIHGTCGVVADSNIAYQVQGHNFFLEDASERGNTITNNLAIDNKVIPDSTLSTGEPRLLFPNHEGPDTPDSLGPSMFWLTNLDNTISGNVASYIKGSGFWMPIPLSPTPPSPPRPMGLSSLVDMYPANVPVRDFSHNFAYSFSTLGFNAFRGFQDSIDYRAALATGFTRIDPTTDEQPLDLYATNIARFLFKRLTACNGPQAYANNTGHPDYEEWMVNNCDGGGFSGTTFPSGGDPPAPTGFITRCVVSAHSLNITGRVRPTPVADTNTPGYSIGQFGTATYHGTLQARNSAFVHLRVEDEFITGGVILLRDWYQTAVEKSLVYATGNKLIDSDLGLMPIPPYWRVGATPRDIPASHAGLDPEGLWGGSAGQFRIFDRRFLTETATGLVDAEPVGWNGKMADGPFYGVGQFISNRVGSEYERVKITRFDSSLVEIDNLDQEAIATHPDGFGGNPKFAAVQDGIYLVEWPDDGPVSQITFALSYFDDTDFTFILGVTTSAPGTSVNVGILGSGSRDYSSVASWAALLASSGEEYWYDSGAGITWAKARGYPSLFGLGIYT